MRTLQRYTTENVLEVLSNLQIGNMDNIFFKIMDE